jgi:hypothetical protein
MKRLTVILSLVFLAIGLVAFPDTNKHSASIASASSTDDDDDRVFPTRGGPDLIVDTKLSKRNWIVRTENLSPTACSVVEGNITPGNRALLRFTVGTPNIGDADLVVGDPNEHFNANDGLFEFATCHNHFHFRHYAIYELVDPRTGQTWRSAKLGFCMVDFTKYTPYVGNSPAVEQFVECGAPGEPGSQGISRGWEDIYEYTLGGQFFVLDGGDGQAPVPPGKYIIRIRVNPGFVPEPGEPCRFADPRRPGICHQLPEANFENNISEIRIKIPSRITAAGSGPLAPGGHDDSDDDNDH